MVCCQKLRHRSWGWRASSSFEDERARARDRRPEGGRQLFSAPCAACEDKSNCLSYREGGITGIGTSTANVPPDEGAATPLESLPESPRIPLWPRARGCDGRRPPVGSPPSSKKDSAATMRTSPTTCSTSWRKTPPRSRPHGSTKNRHGCDAANSARASPCMSPRWCGPETEEPGQVNVALFVFRAQ